MAGVELGWGHESMAHNIDGGCLVGSWMGLLSSLKQRKEKLEQFAVLLHLGSEEGKEIRYFLL